MLLGYLPTTTSKRRQTLRRKRNEYHRFITKYYFEFDFCLTKRQLTAGKNEVKKEKTPKRHLSKIKSVRDSFHRRASTSSSSETSKPPEPASSDFQLLPLFSQPSKGPSQVTITSREDTLLLQIRKDISDMVDIPTTSVSIAKQNQTNQTQNKNNQSQKETNTLEFNGSTKTTRNRLFSNKVVKESLERIIYLWSIRVEDEEPSAYSSRYLPSIIDIIYPLYLTNLHGYIWDNHSSTTGENKKLEQDLINRNVNHNSRSHRSLRFGDDDKEDLINGNMNHASRSRRFSDDNNVPIPDELDDVHFLSSLSEPVIFEDEDRKSRIDRCTRLAIGIGIETIPEEIMEEVEADTYWCLENFMTATNDYRTNHAFASPKATNAASNRKGQKQNPTGLQNMVVLIEKIVQRVDPILHQHLKKHGVEYIWFAYRWVNSIHVRDMNEKCILRVWDTCLCEEVDTQNGAYFSNFGFNAKRARKRNVHLPGFLNFQVYICVALLHQMRSRLLAHISFQDILRELRKPGLENWGPADVDVLLSQAYVWSSSFRDSEEQILDTATEHQDDDTFKTWLQRCHWPPRRQAARPMSLFVKRGKTGSITGI